MEQLKNERRILNYLVGEPAQTVVEGSAVLPAGMPEMEKVLMISPWAQVTSAQAGKGEVLAEGDVTLLICYLCADGMVHSFESTSVFRAGAELMGVQSGMHCMAKALPSAMEYQLNSGRDISVSVTLDLCCTAEEDLPLEAMSVEDAKEDVHVLPREIHLAKNVGRMSLSGEIEGSVPIPGGIVPAERVLCVFGTPEIKRTAFDGETLGVEGELKLSILYETADESAPVAQMYGTLEFSEMVPADHMDGDVEVFPQLGEIHCTLDDMGDSFLVSASCRMEISCRRKFGFVGIADGYAEHGGLELEYQRQTIQERSFSCNGTGALRERMTLGGAPVPARVLACTGMPTSLRAYSQGGMVVLEGMMTCEVAYAGYDGAISTVLGEIPVHLEEPALELGEGDTFVARLFPSQVQAVPAGDEVEIRTLVQYQCEGYRPADLALATGMKRTEEESAPREKGIILYFVQKGDTLWDVAKRYRIPRETILEQNPGLGEELAPGEKLLLVSRPG